MFTYLQYLVRYTIRIRSRMRRTTARTQAPPIVDKQRNEDGRLADSLLPSTFQLLVFLFGMECLCYHACTYTHAHIGQSDTFGNGLLLIEHLRMGLHHSNVELLCVAVNI